MCKVGNGGVMVWVEWVDGEGITEASLEGIGEGCGKVMCGKVGFKISGKDMGECGEFVKADAVDLNWKMARDFNDRLVTIAVDSMAQQIWLKRGKHIEPSRSW